jgi:hypothetical protein
MEMLVAQAFLSIEFRAKLETAEEATAKTQVHRKAGLTGLSYKMTGWETYQRVPNDP